MDIDIDIDIDMDMDMDMVGFGGCARRCVGAAAKFSFR
jgi:hypothetical protein